MKKFLKNKSKNQSQENTIRKIKQNNTVDKKEQTYIMKNSSDEYKGNKIEYKENKRDKSKDNVHKIKSDKATEKNKTKSIELNFGFIILKIIVIALLVLVITTLTAKTVMTRIGTKESTSETENEGIASIATIELSWEYLDEDSAIVYIESDYIMTQIEVSEEYYRESLDEQDYTFIVEDDWIDIDEGYFLYKTFTENIDKAYRVTFEDDTSTIVYFECGEFGYVLDCYVVYTGKINNAYAEDFCDTESIFVTRLYGNPVFDFSITPNTCEGFLEENLPEKFYAGSQLIISLYEGSQDMTEDLAICELSYCEFDVSCSTNFLTYFPDGSEGIIELCVDRRCGDPYGWELVLSR